MMFTALCLIAYAAGALNASILVLRVKTKKDPRTLFSKNAGTTNVYRILGLKWAGWVLITDVGKALLMSAVASRFLSVPATLWVGFFLLLGNRFPCFHGFKGGKGVAHFIGFSLFLTPLFTVLSLAGWCAGYLFFRLPFAGSMVLGDHYRHGPCPKIRTRFYGNGCGDCVSGVYRTQSPKQFACICPRVSPHGRFKKNG